MFTFRLDHSLREIKDFKNHVNFKNKRVLIENIEKDLIENEVLKEYEQAPLYDYKDDNNCTVVKIRKKKKDSEKYDEQLNKVRKKNKLLDFIMV